MVLQIQNFSKNLIIMVMICWGTRWYRYILKFSKENENKFRLPNDAEKKI